MRDPIFRGRISPARRCAGGAMTILALVSIQGCDGLFDVNNPTDIIEEDLENPQAITALSNSAEGAVSLAYDLAVQYGEMPGDGIDHVSNQQSNLDLDWGTLDNVNQRIEELYNQLAASRWTATEVTRRMEELLDAPERDPRVGKSYFWDALARITLADLFRDVPFDVGPPNPPATVYEGAIELLEKSARIVGESDPEFTAGVYGTIARAYRSLYFERDGDMAAFEQARRFAELALQTDPDFQLFIHFQPPGSQNRLFVALSGGSYYDVMGAAYAFQTDPVSGQRDPRIEHGPLEVVGGFGDSVYHQAKYTSPSDDIRVSSWQEAQLILAEYHLLKGELPQAVARINRVRAAAGLPDFAGGDAAAVRAQLLYERKTEFWLELRRWQDMRYYGTIPSRWLPANQQLGVKRRFPVSLRERLANPHY